MAGPENPSIVLLQIASICAANNPQVGCKGKAKQACLPDFHDPGILENHLLSWKPVRDHATGFHLPARQTHKARGDLPWLLGDTDHQDNAFLSRHRSWIECTNNDHVVLRWRQVLRSKETTTEETLDHGLESASCVAAHAMASESRPLSSLITRSWERSSNQAIWSVSSARSSSQ